LALHLAIKYLITRPDDAKRAVNTFDIVFAQLKAHPYKDT